MFEQMDRREFVRLGACVGVGLAVAGASGCTSDDNGGASVETPSWSFGEETAVSRRILVGYATRTGSTTGVAKAIGEALGERGFLVDVKPLRERPSIDDYDAVVVGSAVNGAAWLPEAVSFVESNSKALAMCPVAAFCVHSMNGGSDEKQSRKRLAYLDKIRATVTPVSEGFFLGKAPDAADTSLIARWAFKAFGGAGEGDMRDWDKIRSWADKLPV